MLSVKCFQEIYPLYTAKKTEYLTISRPFSALKAII